MQIIKYSEKDLNKYLDDLKVVGMLSSLFSDSSTPMLYYRATENLYCNAFGATNLARSDVPADAKLGNIGIGIKTFLEQNKKTYQKIEEFNNQHSLYENLEPENKVKKIAELRNKRLSFTMKTYDIKKMIFHCIVRNDDGFHFYEEPMDFIDIDRIEIQNVRANTIDFTDGNHNYKFNITKSTLYKQFITDDYFAEIKVIIAKDPLSLINRNELTTIVTVTDGETIVMPLYSYSHGNRVVPEKSGLNQWNAGGRKRDANEVYIPFLAQLREKYADFFPPRNQSFNVVLPSGKEISMKVCQENGKAIMSNPNKVLGEWILRDVLQLQEKELVTYDKLLELGIDSVAFEKINDTYKLDFRQIDEVEEINENI